MTTFEELWPKLKRSKRYREAFVAQHAKQEIGFQIRALLKQLGLTQAELAERARLTQGVVSRAADPSYGNLTINTLVRIAAGFDVAFVGRFVPFSELPKWFDRIYAEPFAVPPFEEEEASLPLVQNEAASTISASLRVVSESTDENVFPFYSLHELQLQQRKPPKKARIKLTEGWTTKVSADA